MTQPTPSIPLPFQLSRMISTPWVPQAIYAAVSLGLADQLARRPQRSDDLARAVGADPAALRRLARALVTLELCAEAEDGTLALTELGACLRADSPDSVRSWALVWAHNWRYWERFVDSVKTGATGRQIVEGKERSEWLPTDPEHAAIFNQAMVEMTRQMTGPILTGYDFAGIGKLVDVGGGYGQLLAAILEAHPSMRGAVADLPQCREGALALMRERGLDGRFEFFAESFFESVPAGADAYMLKNVIHDWDDEHSLAIEKTCRRAMKPRSRLLLIEVVMPERIGTSPLDQAIVGVDLNMLIATGGRERTVAEHRQLLAAAGLQLERVVATPSLVSVIEAHPV